MGEFNRALLAKHLWRILCNPDSLVGRVVTGRYFKHGTILTASLGNNPSYIWRSHIWSREILETGLIWRVGNGKSIRIFEDKWIPSMQSSMGKPLIPWDHEPTVNSLIRDGTCDVDLIANSFNPYLAGEILKIPLPLSELEDVQFWQFDPRDQYSVRSGCRLERGLLKAPENQSEYHIEKWWSFLWSLSLPPKVRLFWWSVSQDAIPTNLNLARHHVSVPSSCDLCGYASDSTCHALFFYVSIIHLWEKASFSHKLKVARWANILELCFWMKENLFKDEFEEYAMRAWAIWREKQTFLHSDRAKSIVRQISWSEALLEDFRMAKKIEESHVGLVLEEPEKIWKPPGSNGFKRNVDASINSNSNRYNVGRVLRDCQGRLLLAFGTPINQPISVVHGELLAIREGVNLVYEKAFRDIEVVTDSLLTVQAVTANQENLGYDGMCAKDISNRLLKSEISDFYYVSRSTNNVAHKIASFAFSTLSPFV